MHRQIRRIRLEEWLADGPWRYGWTRRRAGGPGVDNSPADFHSPDGRRQGVPERTQSQRPRPSQRSHCTSRSSRGERRKNQELFKKIFDLSLSDSELDRSGQEALKATSRRREPCPRALDASRSSLQKPNKNSNGGYFRRKVTVRHEKKGWGVLDIAGAMEFKDPDSPMPQS